MAKKKMSVSDAVIEARKKCSPKAAGLIEALLTAARDVCDTMDTIEAAEDCDEEFAISKDAADKLHGLVYP